MFKIILSVKSLTLHRVLSYCFVPMVAVGSSTGVLCLNWHYWCAVHSCSVHPIVEDCYSWCHNSCSSIRWSISLPVLWSGLQTWTEGHWQEHPVPRHWLQTLLHWSCEFYFSGVLEDGCKAHVKLLLKRKNKHKRIISWILIQINWGILNFILTDRLNLP